MSSRRRNPGPKIAVNPDMNAQTSTDVANAAPAETLAEALARRAADLTEWLRENAPEVSEDQRHLDQGSAESAYWHYGYLMALRDMRRIIGDGSAS